FNKPKTSEKFVITLLACDNTVTMRHFRKAVRRTLKNKKDGPCYAYHLKAHSQPMEGSTLST
ncbi:MAG: hypothetical protein LWX51_10150, partial [Deltaproteobacteria bacterium]|nr:hypothetical protein [Deltaproteobacteria bacterium]